MGEIRLILGRVGSGKSRRVFAEMRQALREGVDGPLFLFVPDQYASEAERQLISALGVSGLGFGGPDVLTLSLLRRRAFDASVLIDEAGRRMAIRALLDETGGDLLSLPARAFGMPEIISGFFSQARRAGLDEARGDVFSLAQSLGFDADRWADLSHLMNAYRHRLSGRFWDDEEADRRLIEALAHMPELDGAQIWIDRFDSVPRRTAQLIAALAAASRRVTVVLNWDDGHGTLERRSIEPSLTAIAEAASRAGIAVTRAEPMQDQDADPRAPSLTRLVNRLFAPAGDGSAAPEDDGALALWRAPTPAAEAEAVADAVLAYIEGDDDQTDDLTKNAPENGRRPTAADDVTAQAPENSRRLLRDVGVIVSDMGTYAPLLERAFARRGIACFFDRRRPSLAHPAVRALLAALEAVATGWAAEPMAALLRSGYSGLEEDDAALLLRAMRERDLRGARWHYRLKGPWEAAEASRQALMQPLVNLRERLAALDAQKMAPRGGIQTKNDGQPSVMNIAYDYLVATGAPTHLVRDVAALKAQGRMVDALETTQIWDLLMGMLDQAAVIFEMFRPQDSALPAARAVMRVLEAGLGSADVAVIPPTLDEVLVSTPERVKSPPLKRVFLLGANEGMLLPPSAQGLLTEEECAALSARGYHMGTPGESDDLARLRLLGVLASASERVVVSWSLAGEEGGLLRPSPVVAQIRRLFPHLSVMPCPAPALASFPARDAAEPVPGLAVRTPGATALERYARCPWQYFVAEVLRPHRRIEPYPMAANTGTAMHAVAERWLAALLASGRDIAALTREQSDACAREALDEALGDAERWPGWDEGRMTLWRRSLERAASGAVWVAARQIADGEFRPVSIESDMTLALGEAGSVRCRIDRIDRAGAWLRVIDYKTGNQRYDLSDIWHGLHLQLPLYALAAEDSPCFAGRCRMAGLYRFPLHDALPAEDSSPAKELRLFGWTLEEPGVIEATDREKRGEVIGLRAAKYASPAAMDALLHHARDKARDGLAGIASGRFAPNPVYSGDAAPCLTCDAGAACAFHANRARKLDKLSDQAVLAALTGETNPPDTGEG